jgi:hypothetical protein
MNQPLYAHMNNKRKMKKNEGIISYSINYFMKRMLELCHIKSYEHKSPKCFATGLEDSKYQQWCTYRLP